MDALPTHPAVFEFKYVLLGDWFAKQGWILSYSWGWGSSDRFLPFPRVIVRKWSQRPQLKFELGKPISNFAPITATRRAHETELEKSQSLEYLLENECKSFIKGESCVSGLINRPVILEGRPRFFSFFFFVTMIDA